MQPNLVSMDFEDNKQSLKDFLKQQDEFKDYNFEGSGMSILLNALAYSNQGNAYMANMIANESNIDTAVLRENVVSRGKAVGYTPKSKKASKAVISLTISDPTNQASSLLLPRGTKFIAGSGGNVFSFITLQDYNLFLNETTGVYENAEIEIYEGSIKAVSWIQGDGVRFVINSNKIDTDTLRVGVFPRYQTTNGEYYNRALNLERVKPNSTVFWIQETDGARFELLFGDNVFGKKPANTNVIYAEYLNTNGVQANGYSKFSLAGTFSGYSNSQITIATIAPADSGSDAESTSSIKINAPRAWAAQGKATVAEDFQALVKDMYPYARSVNVWGGDEEVPVKYGRVYICVIPTGGGVVTDYSKNEMVRKLKAKGVSGITPVFVDAEYINFNVTATVNVRKNAVAQLKAFSSDIRNQIIEFFDSKFYDFNTSFYYSNLVTDIENYSRAISSVKVDYELSIHDTIGRSIFNFKNSIIEGTVRSTKLQHSTNSTAISIVDKAGKLYLADTVVGTVDYESGNVTITDGTLTSVDNTIEIFVQTVNDDVIVSNRSVIAMNPNRLSVELRAF